MTVKFRPMDDEDSKLKRKLFLIICALDAN